MMGKDWAYLTSDAELWTHLEVPRHFTDERFLHQVRKVLTRLYYLCVSLTAFLYVVVCRLLLNLVDWICRDWKRVDMHGDGQNEHCTSCTEASGTLSTPGGAARPCPGAVLLLFV